MSDKKFPRITILCSDAGHPINPWLDDWISSIRGRALVRLVRDISEVEEGDFLFLIACQQIVRRSVRDRFSYSLIVHESALPQGRGWSPLVWMTLEGSNEIPVTLLNAEDAVDSGAIWRTKTVYFEGTEVHEEIHARISEATIDHMTWALENCPIVQPEPQKGGPTYYRRRTPEDSRVDPHQRISEIFDLLRIADPARYPVFFEFRGQRYVLHIERRAISDEECGVSA